MTDRNMLLSNAPSVWWQDLLGWDLAKHYVADQRWLTESMTECDYVALDGTVWTVLAENAEYAPEGFVQCDYLGTDPYGHPGECAMPADHREAPHVWQQRCAPSKVVILRLSAKVQVK